MSPFTLQGRHLDEAALADIGALLQRQPPLSRRQLSLHLCGLWDWRTDAGQLKDIAARTLLRKLEQRDLIQLPPILRLPPAARAGAGPPSTLPLALEFCSPVPIQTRLEDLAPVKVSVVQAKSDRRLFGRLLQEHHYLGWNRPVGESIAYWAHDRSGRLLALCLWGAASFKGTVSRARFIGRPIGPASVEPKAAAARTVFIVWNCPSNPSGCWPCIRGCANGSMNLIQYLLQMTRTWAFVFPQCRTLERAITLAFGILCGVGKRTLTRAISFNGNTQKDWSADYKLFSRSPWEPRALFDPILQSAIQEHQLKRIVVSTDDTRVWRTGKHVPQTQWHRDPMGPAFQVNLRWGHRFLQASLVLPLYQHDGESSSRSIPIRWEMAPVVKKPGKNATQDQLDQYRRLKKEKNLSVQFVAMTPIC